jgi:hypothetical protein
MAVVWLLLEATGQGFGIPAAPPRSDKRFGLALGSAPPPAGTVSPPSGASVRAAPPEPTFPLGHASTVTPASAPASFPVSAVRPLPAAVVGPATSRSRAIRREAPPAPAPGPAPTEALGGPGRETRLTVTSPAQASATTAALPHADVLAAEPASAVREGPNGPGQHERREAPDAVEESVTVISSSRRPHTPAQPLTPVPNGDLPIHTNWSGSTIRDRPAPGRDLGVGAAARRTAFIVGSRAREAILGYGFANPDAARGGPPQAGEEPAPGHTVVLIGDDVEAWVRERLYGDRLPSR